MADRVTCGLCGHALMKCDAVYQKPKYYHSACYEQVMQKRNLMDYVCNLFNLRAPGPINYKACKTFVEENHWTYNEILQTLKYMYEVKHVDKKYSGDNIWSVKRYFDEAKQYFARQAAMEAKMAQEMAEKVVKAQQEVMYVAGPRTTRRRKVELIDISNLMEEE